MDCALPSPAALRPGGWRPPRGTGPSADVRGAAPRQPLCRGGGARPQVPRRGGGPTPRRPRHPRHREAHGTPTQSGGRGCNPTTEEQVSLQVSPDGSRAPPEGVPCRRRRPLACPWRRPRPGPCRCGLPSLPGASRASCLTNSRPHPKFRPPSLFVPRRPQRRRVRPATRHPKHSMGRLWSRPPPSDPPSTRPSPRHPVPSPTAASRRGPLDPTGPTMAPPRAVPTVLPPAAPALLAPAPSPALRSPPPIVVVRPPLHAPSATVVQP